ncbi:protein LURP-one-related 15-like [Mercurialis annua]|uniref:protein LURP-one-related 15-like n=1 Tax=Mercurialis annua TaxID=3986 RepID=UPI0021604FC1|nr:protein LURP-one-related 15-like [Mercurialis annua]
MAGQPSYPVPAMTTYLPLERPVVVIGPQFLAQYPVDLKIATKLFSLGETSFGVTDVNGAVIFRVKSKMLSIRDRRHLLDTAGNKIATFQQKIMTAHRRWKVFRGESTNDQDLLFTVKKSSMLQFKTELDVCLASNTSENVPDFKIKGSWFERSCTIYLGQSNTIIAQMHRKHNISTIMFDADNFGVTVYPNVDYAFVVALVVILDEINADRSGQD